MYHQYILSMHACPLIHTDFACMYELLSNLVRPQLQQPLQVVIPDIRERLNRTLTNNAAGAHPCQLPATVSSCNVLLPDASASGHNDSLLQANRKWWAPSRAALLISRCSTRTLLAEGTLPSGTLSLAHYHNWPLMHNSCFSTVNLKEQ